jgi:hypothetical protein
LRIEPDPNLEEIAAIVVALAVVSKGSEGPGEDANLFRSRWRLAGLLGHAPLREMKLEDSLWSCSSWEGMV